MKNKIWIQTFFAHFSTSLKEQKILNEQQKKSYTGGAIGGIVFVVIFHLILGSHAEAKGPNPWWIPYASTQASNGPAEPWLPYATANAPEEHSNHTQLWTPDKQVKPQSVDPDRPWQNDPLNKGIQRVQFFPNFNMGTTILEPCIDTAIEIRKQISEDIENVTKNIIQDMKKEEDPPSRIMESYLPQIKNFNYQILMLNAVENLNIVEDEALINHILLLEDIHLYNIAEMTKDQCDTFFSRATTSADIQSKAVIQHWFEFLQTNSFLMAQRTARQTQELLEQMQIFPQNEGGNPYLPQDPSLEIVIPRLDL